MKKVIGENITLRPLVPSDLDFLFSIENDERYWNVSGTTKPYSRELLKKYIEVSKQSLAEAKQYRFVIVKTATTEQLGFIDLFNYNQKEMSAGVGIIIDPNFQNQGFGTSALDLLMHYCREELSLKILHCSIHSSNRYSMQLFTKHGFVKTDYKKDDTSSTDSSKNEIFLQRSLNHPNE
ncbi:MAG: GNAT family N-acetyltransferase [Flavobacteriaceae bacterium]|nr:GNAT family N-acetyltransferase [Flavobacteriaceae bacterium]|tara:strand:- start:45334 stop:45870 length:537 start_codon:yes stop_codon:yes gene_type:complete